MSKTNKLEPFDPAVTGSRTRSLLDVSQMVAKRLGIKIGKEKYDGLKTFGLMIPIEKCYLNYERQRYIDPAHILDLMKKWDTRCVTSLECRYNANEDKYYIADGQQHGIAWTIRYYGSGEGNITEIPANFFTSDDPYSESQVFIALNCNNKPMAKYFIHDQKVKMRDPEAVALENAVRHAGCKTAYKSKAPGSITHFPNLYTARDDYGLNEIQAVLKTMLVWSPNETIETDMMLGFLYVRELMYNDPSINKNIFEDIFNEVVQQVSNYFDSMKQAKLDIMDETKHQFPDSYRGVNKRFPLAAGIIDVYGKKKNRLAPVFVKAPLFSDIKMP